jgi:hypothetical protein
MSGSSLLVIFHVHRSLIWLACWVASAALFVTVFSTSLVPALTFGLQKLSLFLLTAFAHPKTDAKHLCSSLIVLLLKSCGRFIPTVVTPASFINSICSLFLPEALSRFSARHSTTTSAGLRGAFRCLLKRRKGFGFSLRESDFCN